MRTPVALFIFIFSLFIADLVAADERIALVIGNSRYQHQYPLANPARDADAMANAFTKLGFATIWLKQDQSRDDIRRLLYDFADRAATADWAVIYYAGHGIEIGGTNYIIPVDAELKQDRHVRIEAIPLSEMLEAVEGASRLRLVILDACRNNPFIEGMMRSGQATREIGRGLARVEPNKGTLVAYSARHGQLAGDGTGANSPYVSALLRHLDTPGLEISLLFRRVRDSVLQETGGQQEPYTYGSLPGLEYYFRPGAASPPPPPISVSNPVDRDEIVWAGILNSTERQDFAFYLRQFPAGRHVQEAKERLESHAESDAAPLSHSILDRVEITASNAIQDAQQRLFELNYEPGPPDGAMNPLTTQAIKDLQGDINLPVDGILTQALLQRLQSAGSLKPWGAILFAPKQGKWGLSWGEESRAQAIAAAQKSCGGECDKQLTFFKNWCGALAYSTKGWALSSRDSIDAAKAQALASCKQKSSSCTVLLAICADGSGKSISPTTGAAN